MFLGTKGNSREQNYSGICHLCLDELYYYCVYGSREIKTSGSLEFGDGWNSCLK